MATKTYMVASGNDGNFGALVDGVDQTAATRTDGWTVAKIASANMAEFDAGTKQASGTFTTGAKPASFITGTTANAFKTPAALTGIFANTSWTFTFAVRAVGAASAQAGRMRMRVFKSVNADGSSATELTGSTQIGTTSSALSTSADVTTVVTWSPGTTITLNNEYLFFVLAWEITTASGNNSGDVLIRTGQSAGGSRLVTPDLALTIGIGRITPGPNAYVRGVYVGPPMFVVGNLRNLVPIPSYENGNYSGVSWYGSPGAAESQIGTLEQAFHGFWALKVVTTGSAGSGPKTATGVPVSPNTDYIGSVWVYPLVTGSFRILAENSGVGVNYGSVTGGQWTQLVVPFTTGGAQTTENLVVYQTSGATRTFYADSNSVVPANPSTIRGVTVASSSFSVGKCASATVVKGVTVAATGSAGVTIGRRAAATTVGGVTLVFAPSVVPIGRISKINLIKNPNFEIDISDWDNYNSISNRARSTLQAFEGVASIRGQLGTTAGHITLTPINVSPNTDYTLSAYLYSTKVNDLKLRGFEYNAALSVNTANPSGSAVAVSANTWTRLTFTFTTNAGTAKFYPLIGDPSSGYSFSDYLYMDAVQFEPGSVATTYGGGTSVVRGITLTTPPATLGIGAVAAATSVKGITLAGTGAVPITIGSRAAATTVKGITLGAGAAPLPVGRLASATTVKGVTLAPSGAAPIPIGRSAAATTVRGITFPASASFVPIGRVRGVNLVKNPNFEIDKSDWDNFNSVNNYARSTVEFYEGVASLRGQPSITASYVTLTSIVVSPSTTYTFSVWVRTTKTGNTFKLAAWEYNAAETTFIDTLTSSAMAVSANTWTRLTFTFTTNVGAGRVFLLIGDPSTTHSGTDYLYADAVQFEAGSVATAYSIGTGVVRGITLGAAPAGFTIGRVAPATAVKGISLAGTGAAVVPIGRVSGINRVPNPSFEISTSGWDTYGSVSSWGRSTVESYDGVASLRGQMPATAGFITTAPILVSPSTPYTYSVYFRSTIANTLKLWGYEYNSAESTNTAVPNSGAMAISANAWTRLTFTFTTNAGTAKFYPLLGDPATTYSGSDYMYADAVQFEAGSVATAYGIGTSVVRGVTLSSTSPSNITVGTRAAATTVRGVTLAPSGFAPIYVGRVSPVGTSDVPYTFDAERSPSIAPASGELHFGPAIISSTISENVTADTLGDGACVVGGAVFVATRSSSSKVYKWADPKDPHTYSVSAVTGVEAENLEYDATTGSLYIAGMINIGGQRKVTIKKVDPSTLAISSFVTQSDVGTVGKLMGKNNGLCTDGTHIWLITCSQEENSWIYKYRLSDGVQVASRHIGNTPGGTGTGSGNVIKLGGDGYLYIGGGQGTSYSPNMWAGRVPLDLSSELLCDIPGAMLSNDDGILVGNYLWLGDETREFVYKVKRDMSSVDYIALPKGCVGMDGFEWDGHYLWVGVLGVNPPTYPSAGFSAIDVNTNRLVKTYAMPDGIFKPNELFRFTGGIFISTLEGAPTGHALWCPLNLTYEATTVATSYTDRAAGGQTAMLSSLDSNTPPGRLVIRKVSDPRQFVAYNMNGATDQSGWESINVLNYMDTIPSFDDGDQVTASFELSRVYGVILTGSTGGITVGRRASATSVKGITLAPAGAAPISVGKRAAATTVRGIALAPAGQAPITIGRRASATSVKGITLAPAGAAPVTTGRVSPATVVRGITVSGTGTITLTIGRRAAATTVRGIGVASAGVSQITVGKVAAATLVRGATVAPAGAAPVAVGRCASATVTRGVALAPSGAAPIIVGRRAAATTVRGVTLAPAGAALVLIGKRATITVVRGVVFPGALYVGSKASITVVSGVSLVYSGVQTIPVGRRASATTTRGITLSAVGIASLPVGKRASATVTRGVTVTGAGTVQFGVGRRPATTVTRGIALAPGVLQIQIGSRSAATVVREVTTVATGVALIVIGKVQSVTRVRGVFVTGIGVVPISVGHVPSFTAVYGLEIHLIPRWVSYRTGRVYAASVGRIGQSRRGLAISKGRTGK